MFRNPIREFRLSEGSSRRGPAPFCKPALEVLEERIVLSGASTRPPLLAERAQALAAADASTAAQQAVTLAATGMQQFGILQGKLDVLAARMVKVPVTARPSFVNRAAVLVNR